MVENGTGEALALVFNNMEIFVLVMVRIAGFFVIMPFFSGTSIPMRSRVAFAFVCSLLVVVSGNVELTAVTAGFIEFFLIIVNEFLAGFFIGFVAYMFFTIFHLVGQQVDFQIGFMMVSVHDPITQIQTPITGNLFYFAFLAMFVAADGLSLVMYFVLLTYSLIPPGAAFIAGNYGLVDSVLGMMHTYFELGLTFTLPIVSVLFIVNVALGILVKAVPQMNIFVVGLPIKVGIGLLTIFLLTRSWYYFILHPFQDRVIDSILDTITRLAGS